MKTITAMLTLVLVFSAAPALSAAGDDCLRQGEFALELAKKLNLAVEAENDAAAELTKLDIGPVEGWKLAVVLEERVFNEIDRAVVVAFSHGKLTTNLPSAAQAVLSGIGISRSCQDAFHTTAPVREEMSLAALAGIEASRVKAFRAKATPAQQKMGVDVAVAESNPALGEPDPGTWDGDPISNFEPQKGPGEKGPGSW